MLIGAHTILREVLKLTTVDAGRGWPIFGLPPSEVAVHPARQNDRHELYLMCEDIEAFIAEMRLPGGGQLGVHQPRHPRPGSKPKPASKRKP